MDGARRFEKDDVLTVDDTAGAYFVQNGWAVEAGATSTGAPSTPTTDLNIQNSAMGVGDNRG